MEPQFPPTCDPLLHRAAELIGERKDAAAIFDGDEAVARDVDDGAFRRSLVGLDFPFDCARHGGFLLGLQAGRVVLADVRQSNPEEAAPNLLQGVAAAVAGAWVDGIATGLMLAKLRDGEVK